MPFPSDLDIARSAALKPLTEVADAMDIGSHLLEPYGEHVAKIKLSAIDELASRPKAKYVVVSAVTPTPLGEGKTTTTVGLGQALARIGRRATVAIRQPSMGPTFGIKGGAAGGGYSQVVPMDILNLHLTGDFHAVTAAHNMLSAVLDNHLFQGNAAGLDPHNITWRRVLDVNDRVLRNVIVGLGTHTDGIPRQTGFDITAASEVMAIFALARSVREMRERFGRIVVGYTDDKRPVTAEDIRGAGAMAVIMRDALKPNLMQTLEHTPVLVHAGPFGNIAHGNSSVVADLIGIRGGDFLVTEAGFGADMGAERFFNIKCRASGLTSRRRGRGRDGARAQGALRAPQDRGGPAAAGGVAGGESGRGPRRGCEPAQADREHPAARGVAGRGDQRVSRRPSFRARGDRRDRGVDGRAGRGVHALHRWRARGDRAGRGGGRGRGGALDVPVPLPGLGLAEGEDRGGGDAGVRRRGRRLRPEGRPPARDLRAQRVRGSAGVHRQDPPVALLGRLAEGRAHGWRLPVREVRASVGAGFIYPICGDMRTMPGLGADPAAHAIDIDADGNIVNLS